jgi:formate dehydrogenase
VGNPTFFGYAASSWLGGFQAALDVKWRYGVNSEDAAARIVASKLLYGSVAAWLKPDLWRTRFLVMVGANPFVSHSSLYCEPHVRDALHGIVARGGRVVVVDPRRSETARHFEHIAVRPGTDAYPVAVVRTSSRTSAGPGLRGCFAGADRLRGLLRPSTSTTRRGSAAWIHPAAARARFRRADRGVVYGRRVPARSGSVLWSTYCWTINV